MALERYSGVRQTARAEQRAKDALDGGLAPRAEIDLGQTLRQTGDAMLCKAGSVPETR